MASSPECRARVALRTVCVQPLCMSPLNCARWCMTYHRPTFRPVLWQKETWGFVSPPPPESRWHFPAVSGLCVPRWAYPLSPTAPHRRVACVAFLVPRTVPPPPQHIPSISLLRGRRLWQWRGTVDPRAEDAKATQSTSSCIGRIGPQTPWEGGAEACECERWGMAVPL